MFPIHNKDVKLQVLKFWANKRETTLEDIMEIINTDFDLIKEDEFVIKDITFKGNLWGETKKPNH